MKTKNATLHRSLGGVALAGAALLLASSAPGQNLFVSNYGNNVYEIPPGGGSSSPYVTDMDYSYGLAFDSAGDLFVANSANNAGESGYITEITPGGSQSRFYSNIDPTGLAFNSSGDLFEADYRSGNIYEYTPQGVQSTFASGFSGPISLAFNSTGDLFVGSGYDNGSITEILPNQTQVPFASNVNYPNGMAFNSAGILFVSSQGSGAISEYTTLGAESPFVTVPGGYGLEGLAFDGTGNLYAAYGGMGAVIKITPGGSQSTYATASGILDGLAFQPVPEPSVPALLTACAAVFFAFRQAQKTKAIKA